jgi:hypothetical protein
LALRDIVFRIILEYIVAARDFAPLKLDEMIHPNLVVKRFTFIFGHFIFSHTSSNVHPAPTDFVTNP